MDLPFRTPVAYETPNYATPLNPVDFLLKAASIRPQHPAIIHPEQNRQWTYHQWAIRVMHLVYALKKNGIKPGDRVLVCAPNTPMMCDCIQAIPAAQAVLVPINIRLTATEVMYLLEHSGSKLVIVDSQFADLMKSAKVPVIVCNDTGINDPYEAFIESGASYNRKLGNKGWRALHQTPDELATFAICYTSGTTGRPKGVEYTYRGSYLAALANALEARLANESRYLWILPMFHCIGWLQPYACTAMMCTQYCLRAVGNYDDVWKGFLERGITHYSGAPTVQLAIVNHPQARKLEHPVTVCVAGAAPTATLIEGLEKLGIQVTHVYGLTETYGPTTRTYFHDPSEPNYFVKKARQDSAFLTADDIRVVKPIAEGKELSVRPGDLVDVAPNGKEIGEIVMRGNITMKGYYKNPTETAKVFAGGYFHSGDLAVQFPDGSFSIQDRQKDIIISGGENVSSLAVEQDLVTHPEILEAAVVARPDPKYGERVHAFVVLKPGSQWAGKAEAFEAEVKAYCKPRLPGFARPAWVEIVPELEKTSTGKVSKKTLREKFKKQSKL